MAIRACKHDPCSSEVRQRSEKRRPSGFKPPPPAAARAAASARCLTGRVLPVSLVRALSSETHDRTSSPAGVQHSGLAVQGLQTRARPASQPPRPLSRTITRGAASSGPQAATMAQTGAAQTAAERAVAGAHAAHSGPTVVPVGQATVTEERRMVRGRGLEMGCVG